METEYFNYSLAQKDLLEILSRFSENPVEAWCLWIADDPDDVKKFIETYAAAVRTSWALASYFER